MKQNLHTHCTFCDGKDSVEDLVQKAISLGFTDIGFSSHGYHPLDEISLDDESEKAWMAEVAAMKEKYADKIHVWQGVEEDMSGRNYQDYGLDYIIASVHFVATPLRGWRAVDYSCEMAEDIIRSDFGGDWLEYCKAYYREVAGIAQRPEADIVGHLDLVTKYNEGGKYGAFDDPAYLNIVCPVIDRLVEAGKIFEINTGAIARGYRSDPYPDVRLLKYIQKKGGKILFSSDCHDKDFLDVAFGRAKELARTAGFTEVQVLGPEGFVSYPLDDYAV